MIIEVILGLVGGPILALLTTFITLLARGLNQAKKDAKKEGIKEVQEQRMQQEINAAHDKIRSARADIEQLSTAKAEDAVRFENFTAAQSEMKSDIKEILRGIQGFGNALSKLEGKVEGNGYKD